MCARDQSQGFGHARQEPQIFTVQIWSNLLSWGLENISKAQLPFNRLFCLLCMHLGRTVAVGGKGSLLHLLGSESQNACI